MPFTGGPPRGTPSSWFGSVQATIAAASLPTFDVAEGRLPLCAFLGVAVPAAPFPRTNTTQEFVEAVSGDKQ